MKTPHTTVHFDEIPYLMEVMAEQGLDVANSWKVRACMQ